MVSTQPPSGFRDFLPEEALRRAQLIKLISETYESFGFLPIDSPAFESINVLEGSGGEENEKLIFKVLKRGEKFKSALQAKSDDENSYCDFGLRFDLTVPLSRMVAEYRGQIHFPWKVYHIASVWRAERAQKGRFREFTQCDVDIVGSKGGGAELEVIQAVSHAVARVGAKDFELKINDRRLLVSLAKHFGFADDQADRFAIILDKKDKIDTKDLKDEFSEILGKTVSAEIDGLLAGNFDLKAAEKLNPEIGTQLKSLIENLQKIELPLSNVSFDASLARGLGYYTGPVFELRHPSAGYSLGGGGRYDKLIGRFSKQEVPACGFSIGFDRLLMMLSESKKQSERTVFVPIFIEEQRSEVIKALSPLRAQGVNVDIYPDSAKLKNQFKYASDRGFRWVLIMGDEELKSKVYKLKDFISGEERPIAYDRLISDLKPLLLS